jgi:hypothetical protein
VSPEPDQDQDRAPDRAPGRDPMAATDQAGNAELVIDEDLDPEEPGRDAAEHAERLERHAEPASRPDAPPAS